jgi:hypothetical protein
MFFGTDPRHYRKLEWLGCGQITEKQNIATYPVINGKLFFDNTRRVKLDDQISWFSQGNTDVRVKRGDLSQERYIVDSEWDWEREGHVVLPHMASLTITDI